MRVQKLNVIKDINEKDFHRWEQMGYKKVGETQKTSEKPAIGPSKQSDK